MLELIVDTYQIMNRGGHQLTLFLLMLFAVLFCATYRVIRGFGAEELICREEHESTMGSHKDWGKILYLNSDGAK